MTIRFKAWTAALVCCLLVAPAMADDNPDSYISINAGQSNEKDACQSPWVSLVAPGISCSEKYIVYRLAYGYQFTPAWGLEISYGDVGYAEAHGVLAVAPPPGIGPANYSWSLKTTGLAIAATGTLHLTDGLSLFGKLGGVRAEFKEDAYMTATNGAFSGISLAGIGTTNFAKNHWFYGAGIQVDASSSVAIRLQYENFGTYDVYGNYGISTFPKIRLTLASAGVAYKF